MKSMKLNFEDFKANQLTRIQTSNIIGGDLTAPFPEIDEDGNPVITNNNGDVKGGGIIEVVIIKTP